jgi:hypothetical protein
MQRRANSYGRALLGALLLGVCCLALAEDQPTLADLQASGRLQIKTWIEPQDAIVARQQVTLLIEVGTDTWFSAGTRIGRLELADAIVLRRENFAVNSTRVEGGTSYTTQLWSITIYPQRAGLYAIPPLPIILSIADGGNPAIEGELLTPATSFTAQLPAGLNSTDDWVSAENFRVEESYSRGLDDLQPGDAVQRQITFSADNTAAMMLPEIIADKQDGIGVYQKPPQLSDDSNRGSLRARRTESITYVIEKPGSYRLPARTFYWWDLQSQSLQEAILPEQILAASGAAVQTVDAQPASPAHGFPWRNLILVLAMLSLLAFAWLAWRRRRQSRGAVDDRRPRKTSEQQLQRELKLALQRQDWPKTVQVLYTWLDNYGPVDSRGSLRKLVSQLPQSTQQAPLDQLMLAAYYDQDCNSTDIEKFVQSVAQSLRERERHAWWRPPPIELKLN